MDGDARAPGGAYDLGYFLGQSMTATARRSCEDALLDRYRERLAEYTAQKDRLAEALARISAL